MKQIRPLLIAFLLVCVSGVYAQNSIADSVRNILRQFQREYGSALSCRLLSVEVDTRRRQVIYLYPTKLLPYRSTRRISIFYVRK